MPASATIVTSRSRWAVMNARIVGSMVAVSARLPSNASTASGNPEASVSRPMGDLRLEAPLLGEARLAEPVAGVGLEVQGGHVVQHQRRRPELGVPGARRRQLLPPRRLRILRQPPLERGIRRRGDAGLFKNADRVQLGSRIDDPGQHQLREHRVPTRGLIEPQRAIRAGQRVDQMPHQRGGDRQRPAHDRRRGHVKAQVEDALPASQPLPRNGLQQRKISIGVRGPDVLDIAASLARRMHDLDRASTRRGFHSAHVRGHNPRD